MKRYVKIFDDWYSYEEDGNINWGLLFGSWLVLCGSCALFIGALYLLNWILDLL